MKRLRITMATGALVAALAGGAGAFSLLGPFTTWQTAQLGYQVFANDLGGPMALGEEYRLTVPLLTYGFDASFLNYFGTNGVRAVDEAFAILNALPHVTEMRSNLSEFPTTSRLQNFQARELGIIDLKSTVLGIIVAQMGLANPNRYVWTLRNRSVTTTTPPVTNYLVIKRNFDPLTLAASSFVNDVLYTYDIREFVNPAFTDAVERSVSPSPDDSLTRPVANTDDSGGGNFISLTAQSFGLGPRSGEFLTGLTRDDAGGLRYLFRFNNFNIESLAPGVSNVAVSNGIFGPQIGAGTGLPSPWGPSGTTNVTLNLTNAATNSIITGLRPGIGRVTYQKVEFDSLLYTALSRRVTNRFVDVVITNAVITNQLVQRIIAFPDILFTAADLGTVGTTAEPFLYARSLVTGRWINNSGTNFITGTGPVVAAGGPGVIPPGGAAAGGGGAAGAGIAVTFTTLAPSFRNETPFFLSEGALPPGFVWGWFDQSTIFAIFPTTTTLQELEALVLRP
jgi:hypothetical protein